jgi:hypothetical protein
MKKVLLIMLMSAFIVPAMVSCKKGANDPTISLKSRNSRITAEWKLVKIAGSETYYGGGTTYSATFTYDGTNFIVAESPAGGFFGNGTATGAYTMTILKDGALEYSESFTPSGGTLLSKTGKAFWYWGNNDNNKIAISFTDGGDYLVGLVNNLYNIDELKSKELILVQSGSITDNGHPDTWEFTYTFEAQ